MGAVEQLRLASRRSDHPGIAHVEGCVLELAAENDELRARLRALEKPEPAAHKCIRCGTPAIGIRCAECERMAKATLPDCPDCKRNDPAGTHSYGTKQHPEPELPTRVVEGGPEWGSPLPSEAKGAEVPVSIRCSQCGHGFMACTAALDAMRARAEMWEQSASSACRRAATAEKDLEEARGLLQRWTEWFASGDTSPSIGDDTETFLSRTEKR